MLCTPSCAHSTEFAPNPEATLTAHGLPLTNAERELVERLRPLLALPAEALLQRLLGDGPNGEPIWWDSYPPLVTYLG